MNRVMPEDGDEKSSMRIGLIDDERIRTMNEGTDE